MTTLITTSTIDSQMHNNIMEADSRDHPPMLATRKYAQWQSRFLRYINTRPNGLITLRKCILEGLGRLACHQLLLWSRQPRFSPEVIPDPMGAVGVYVGSCKRKSIHSGASEHPWRRNLSAIMSADSAVTYTSVHSEARSWSIPSEDPYEEAAQQLFEQAPRHLEYVPEKHIPGYIPEPEHPEDLVPAEDEAPIPLLPPSFLSLRIRPLSPRALEVEMRDVVSAFYHSLHPSGTPPLLPIPLPAPSTSRRADIPEADTPPWKRLLLTTPRPGCEVGEIFAAAAAKQPGPTIETRL
ncbi:hypothetical protein Tco_0302891 [Tanacetum coccineum]